MSDMKSIHFGPRSRVRCLHIEAPGCIINIRQGLSTHDGLPVTSVQVIPDGQMAGEDHKWELADSPNSGSANVRVVRKPAGDRKHG